jgi:3-deoxy-D-manno-octulosonic-acid transferase
VSGAIKFDNAEFDRGNPATQRLARLANIDGEDVVFLAGSTRDGENEIVVRVFASLLAEFPELRLVIVPRNAKRFDEVCRDLESHGISHARRSRLNDDAPSASRGAAKPRALVVDVFGELPAWWGLARIGFVGNSLTQHGGQNMIEPAAYGVATCFGPNNENFQDVVALLTRAGGAAVVHSEDELRAFVRRCLLEPQLADQLGRRGQAAVASRRGALNRTIQHLEEFFAEVGLAGVAPAVRLSTRAQVRFRKAS